MSFGFRIKNQSADIMASEETYSAVFIGQATYTGVDYTWPYLNPDMFGVYAVNSYFFTITTTQPIIPFIKASDIYAGVTDIAYVGTTATITVAVRGGSSLPEIWCFAKPDPAPTPSGYGLALFDASGDCTFDTENQYLIPRFVNNITVPASGAYYRVSGSLVGPTCNTADGITSVPSTTLSQPAYFYAMGPSAAASGYGLCTFFEAVAKYNTSTQAMHVQWHNAFHSFGGSSYFNQSAKSVLCLGIDCADYL